MALSRNVTLGHPQPLTPQEADENQLRICWGPFPSISRFAIICARKIHHQFTDEKNISRFNVDIDDLIQPTRS
jgi:hypothetical protein